jgi:hypothetical protein
MSTLTIHIPGRAIHFHGAVHEDNLPAIADALERQLPLIAEHYGRATAVVTSKGVAHIIATRRSECRS